MQPHSATLMTQIGVGQTQLRRRLVFVKQIFDWVEQKINVNSSYHTICKWINKGYFVDVEVLAKGGEVSLQKWW